MNILYLLDVPINTIGGAQKSTKLCADIMKKFGKVVILNADKNSKPKYLCEDIIIYTIKRNYNLLFYYFLLSFKLIYICSKEKINIINSQTPYSALLISWLKKFKIINKKILIIHTDRGYLNAYPKKYLKLLKFSCDKFNGIITTTDNNLRNWIEFSKKCKCTCIYNVLNPTWYNLKEPTHYNSNILKICFCGRFEAYKRWDNVKKIISKFKQNNKVSFIIILADNNDGTTKEMKQYIKEVQSIDNSIVIYNNLSEEKVKTLFLESDIFILTSENESFGRTIIEAMLTYNIPIGTNSGGVPNVIGNRDNLYDVDDIDRCVDIINRYLEFSEEDICNEKKKFYEYAMKKFSFDAFEKKLFSFYIDILK